MTKTITPEAIILLGLPLAGKSTWASANIDPDVYEMVSADVYKEAHPEYDPENTFALHEWSIEKAELDMGYFSDQKKDIAMDGGGINNRYTKRIINMLKAKGYYIRLVHIKTPYRVCLERNKLRERKVPEESITDKALKETSQFHKLKALVDSVKIVPYYTNENIFCDMDGVIAAQSCLPIINGEIDFVNGEVHKWAAPVLQVLNKLDVLMSYGYNVHILSATPNSFSSDEKHEWLDKYFDIPREKRFFVNQGRHKAEMLDNLRRKFKMKKSSILMIDDFHDILYKVQDRNMNSMHVSEFLTYTFQYHV